MRPETVTQLDVERAISTEPLAFRSEGSLIGMFTATGERDRQSAEAIRAN